MRVASIVTSFLEVPGQLSLSVFTQGCSLNCSEKCHNPLLKLKDNLDSCEITPEQFIEIVKVRRICEWVCFLGGEPTDQNELWKFMQEAKSSHKLVALYTGKPFEDVSVGVKCYCDFIKSGPFDGKDPFDESSKQQVHIHVDNQDFVRFVGIDNITTTLKQLTDRFTNASKAIV